MLLSNPCGLPYDTYPSDLIGVDYIVPTTAIIGGTQTGDISIGYRFEVV